MNRLHSSGTDVWLTPPSLVEALGPFDLDPCCPGSMPWRTAGRMISLEVVEGGLTVRGDGLAVPWEGRVWCNPPYSDVLPWARKMVAHANGIMLVSSKSTETKWAQLLLSTCDAVFFLRGRLAFHYPDGEQSKGKWLSNMLVAYGEPNVASLAGLPQRGFPGVLFRR